MIARNGAGDVFLAAGEGSRDNLEMVVPRGEADMAVVQGGIPIPEDLDVLGTLPGR